MFMLCFVNGHCLCSLFSFRTGCACFETNEMCQNDISHRCWWNHAKSDGRRHKMLVN
jgi:hypothetical protein